MNYVTRDGKRYFNRQGRLIELVPEDVGHTPRRRHTSEAPRDRFFGCPIWWLKCVHPVVATKDQLIVAIYLWRRHIVCNKREAFDVPNGELKAWGVSRKAKKRTLELLAAADVVRVIQPSAKAAPAVTILTKKPGRKR
jgi:hypothetical protein